MYPVHTLPVHWTIVEQQGHGKPAREKHLYATWTALRALALGRYRPQARSNRVQQKPNRQTQPLTIGVTIACVAEEMTAVMTPVGHMIHLATHNMPVRPRHPTLPLELRIGSPQMCQQIHPGPPSKLTCPQGLYLRPLTPLSNENSDLSRSIPAPVMVRPRDHGLTLSVQPGGAS